MPPKMLPARERSHVRGGSRWPWANRDHQRMPTLNGWDTSGWSTRRSREVLGLVGEGTLRRPRSASSSGAAPGWPPGRAGPARRRRRSAGLLPGPGPEAGAPRLRSGRGGAAPGERRHRDDAPADGQFVWTCPPTLSRRSDRSRDGFHGGSAGHPARLRRHPRRARAAARERLRESPPEIASDGFPGVGGSLLTKRRFRRRATGERGSA